MGVWAALAWQGWTIPVSQATPEDWGGWGSVPSAWACVPGVALPGELLHALPSGVRMPHLSSRGGQQRGMSELTAPS